MNQNIINYLQSIGMGEKLIERVESLHDIFVAMTNETIQDAIVSEYINEDGQRQYVSVFFFSSPYLFEANNFLSTDGKLWITSLVGTIAYSGFTYKNFDFKTADTSSRLNIEVLWKQGTDFNLDMKASGNNCLHLIDIYKRYIQSNIMS